MTSVDQVEVVLLVLCLLLSAFFSSAETAFIGSDQLRLEKRAEDGDRGAVLALALLQNQRRLLTTILIGNNIANVLAASLGTLLAVHHLGEKVGVAVGGVSVTILLVIFCEVFPKSYAASHAERLAARFANPIRAAIWLFKPISFPIEWIARRIDRKDRPGSSHSPEEARATVRRWAEQGLLPEAEARLVTSSLRLRELPVKAVMTPLAQLVAMSESDSLDRAISISLREGHSRLPVYRERIDDVVGVLHLRDAIAASRAGRTGLPVRDEMRTPLFVPATQLAGDVLRLLQDRRTAIAVVTDEFGGAVGVCTVEDIVEELVGEIREEHDLEPALVSEDPSGDLIASGQAPIRELCETWNLDLPDGPYRTLQGLFFSALCRMPEKGDRIDVDGLLLEVESADTRRLRRVRIHRRTGSG